MKSLEIVVSLAALLALAAYSLWSWRRASRIRRLEQDLPAALYSLASFEPHVPVESALSEVAASTPEPLRSALSECVRQVRFGVPLPKALDRLRRQGGFLMDRAVQLLQAAHQSGADLSDVFRKVAQDAHEVQRLQSSRREAFALPKYTLYAGVVLVPALLALLYAWAGPSSAYGTAVFWGFQFYLAAFGVLSAAFVGVVQSDSRLFSARALALSACGLWVFHAVRALAA